MQEQGSTSIEARVARGAEWLDATKPGWERLVDLAELDLSNGCRCVLGHVFREEGEQDSTSGYGWVTWEMESLPPGFCNGGDYGFASADEDTQHSEDQRAQFWSALDEAWIALIKSRFDTGCLSDGAA